MALAPRRFGEFELDRARYELRRQGRALKLERIPMELLLLLAEREGAVVSRQEIVERLWGRDVHVDTEHGINTAIRKIRAILREDGERPRFIQTVQGKGYRFVSEAAVDGAHSWPEAMAPAPVTSDPSLPAQPVRWSWAAGVAAIVLLAGVAIGLDVGGIRQRPEGARPVPRIRSIAVLPLANLSGDPSQDYFADGLTDELITTLAKNPALRVVSRTSVMQYKNVHRPLREIGGELGVEGILEGSVERSGARVHMTVQLVDAARDTHLWAESYDRKLEDSFSLPAELSATIAREVRVAAAPAGPQRSIAPEAHDAYLRGRYFWLSESYDRSQEYFEKAIRLQPDYASAWAGLADSYIVRAVALTVPPGEVVPKAREAAEKAVALDDSLPEAHNARAAVRFFGDWDAEAAEAESLRALDLDPRNAEVRHLHSYVLLALGRGDEALEEQRRSTELDPFARPWALGFALIHARKFDEAVAELHLRAEAQPKDALTRFMLSDAESFKGMWKESVEEMEKGFRAADAEPTAAAVHHAFESGGSTGVVEWEIERLQALAAKGYVAPLRLARAWARRGRAKEALHYLEEACGERSAWLVFLQNDPVYDFLHGDPRYRALVEKLGFPPQY